MSLTRYEPWNLVSRMHRDLDRLFGRDWGETDDDSRGAVSDWLPAVDVQESGAEYVLRADLPGVDPKDIEITMDNGVLTLRGTRASEQRDESAGRLRIERITGQFFRRFTLPDSADAERISAEVANGVLTVRIAKRPEGQPKRVQVKSA